MSRLSRARSTSSAVHSAFCAAVALALAGPTAAVAVVVNQPKAAVETAKTSVSLDELRKQYRRPETIPFPKDNPYTAAKFALGKALFFDSRLSAANVLSCGSCHNPAYGWGDGQPKGVGHGMKQLGRRSPSIVNAAFGQIFHLQVGANQDGRIVMHG